MGGLPSGLQAHSWDVSLGGCIVHDGPFFSRIGASGNPGAVKDTRENHHCNFDYCVAILIDRFHQYTVKFAETIERTVNIRTSRNATSINSYNTNAATQ